jgi:hypothetical protein
MLDFYVYTKWNTGVVNCIDSAQNEIDFRRCIRNRSNLVEEHKKLQERSDQIIEANRRKECDELISEIEAKKAESMKTEENNKSPSDVLDVWRSHMCDLKTKRYNLCKAQQAERNATTTEGTEHAEDPESDITGISDVYRQAIESETALSSADNKDSPTVEMSELEIAIIEKDPEMLDVLSDIDFELEQYNAPASQSIEDIEEMIRVVKCREQQIKNVRQKIRDYYLGE